MSTVRSEQLQRYWDNQINRGHHRRLELYNQGLTDQKIADVLRMTKTGITSWRKRNGLPANGDGGKTFGGKVPMEKALAPDQCEIVRQFFGCLLAMQDEYPNRKIDVGVFMREYRAGGHARRSSCAVC